MNWYDLNKNIYNNNKLKRVEEVQDKYDRYLAKFKKTKDLERYLLNKYLDNRLYILTQNKFPYNIDKTIKHYILWINPLVKKKRIYNKKFIKSILNSKIDKKKYKFIYYINQKKYRSIKNIPHYHVFITKI